MEYHTCVHPGRGQLESRLCTTQLQCNTDLAHRSDFTEPRIFLEYVDIDAIKSNLLVTNMDHLHSTLKLGHRLLKRNYWLDQSNQGLTFAAIDWLRIQTQQASPPRMSPFLGTQH